MKLIDFISNLNEFGNLDSLLFKENVNQHSEHLSVYMREPLDVESEIVILGIEETDEELFIKKDNVYCTQLFPLEEMREIVQGGIDSKKLRYSQIASKLLRYRLDGLVD